MTSAEELRDEVAAHRPAAVVHLAGLSSVGSSWGGAAQVWQVNALGTVNVLDAVAAAAASARVLVVSTGEVYGDTGDEPAGEERPLAPLSPYAASKAAAEVACERARRADGLDVVVARAFSHTGPGQDERFAVGSWARQVARLELQGGGSLAVGDLSAERALLDVRDVCAAYVALLRPDVPGGVYNVASSRPVRMAHVLDLIVRAARCPVEVRQDPQRLRPAEIRRLSGDVSRLRAATSWAPETPLERTLADALDEARRAEAVARAAAS